MKRRLKVVTAFAVLCASLVLGATVASAVPPLTTVEDASEVTYTTARVKGTVNPQGLFTTYRFQVVTQEQFEAEGFSSAFGEGEEVEGSREGAGAEAVEGKLQNLQPGITYHLRLFAESDDGSSKSVAASTFETEAVSAPDAILLAPAVGSESAELKGEVDPGGSDPAFDANYFFEVSTDGGNSWAGFEGSEGGVPAEGGKQAVIATLANLEPNTTYDLRLRATNNYGMEDADSGQSFSTGALPPTVETLGTLDFTGTEVTFNGRLHPHKAQTTYWFEWGTEPGNYTASVPLAKDGDAGASNQQVLVAETISGLQPGTTVYYRLVAENGTGGEVAGDEREATTREVAGPPAPCPNQAIREEQSATFLPECRAWEQVSPSDKNGTDVQNFLKVNKNGSGVAWLALGAFAGVRDPNGAVVYVSRRAGDGNWTTEARNSRFTSTASVDAGYAASNLTFSEDFRTMVFQSAAPYDIGDHDFQQFGPFSFPKFDVYRVGEDGNTQWLSGNQGEPLTNEPVDARLAGISGDGTTVIFETTEALTPEVSTQPDSNCLASAPSVCNLYRWKDGQLEAIARDEKGNLLSGASLGRSTGAPPQAGSGYGGDLPQSAAVSEDGESFVYLGAGNQTPAPQLYLRKSDGSIVRISSSQRTGSIGEPAPGLMHFLASANDLRRIYFWCETQLTDDAPVGGGDYVYDVTTGILAFSNVDENELGTGISRTSRDGSDVYFASAEALTPGATAFHSSEGLNVYWRGLHGLRLVGSTQLDPSELVSAGVQALALEDLPVSVTGDGTRYVFRTKVPNVAGAPANLPQVYLYDAGKEAVGCLSCPPPGVAAGAAGYVQVEQGDLGIPSPRAVTEDGTRVVFTSSSALVPRDTNGVSDVYEWTDGRVRLISSGTSPYRSFFVGMSESGDDIFFQTREPLAVSDTDGGNFDIYDAHVDGGFASPSRRVPVCSGDVCQPQVQSQLTPAPGSTWQRSRGNISKAKARGIKHRKKHHSKRRHHHKKVTTGSGAKRKVHGDRRASR